MMIVRRATTTRLTGYRVLVRGTTRVPIPRTYKVRLFGARVLLWSAAETLLTLGWALVPGIQVLQYGTRLRLIGVRKMMMSLGRIVTAVSYARVALLRRCLAVMMMMKMMMMMIVD